MKKLSCFCEKPMSSLFDYVDQTFTVCPCFFMLSMFGLILTGYLNIYFPSRVERVICLLFLFPWQPYRIPNFKGLEMWASL